MSKKRFKKCLVKDIKIFLKKKKKQKIIREYGREQYNNLPENEKQRLVEYKKRYYEMQKIK